MRKARKAWPNPRTQNAIKTQLDLQPGETKMELNTERTKSGVFFRPRKRADFSQEPVEVFLLERNLAPTESRPPPPLSDLLPPELLSKIADGLSLIDLLSFRSVCKAWNSASATASAQNESSYEPWFLLYEEQSDQCQLLICESGKKYTISNIPELKGATCLASNQGWLLLFKPS
ncbi:hypothetical protein L3X38_025773 [Prunus dulcis]|uniref:F-box domain-containing protein n=1 Tax=Prunus dulcis TaxID=3755 RepID=A0AAD4W2A4_PRUDU|nr:hypothetical protein L3X38_025773 [Prunus dulcis]